MDYELIILHTLVEIVMDEDASEHLKELRIAALNKVLRRLNAYHHLGFIRPLTTAIAEKKCSTIQKAATQAEIKRILGPRCPRYDGNKFVEDPSIGGPYLRFFSVRDAGLAKRWGYAGKTSTLKIESLASTTAWYITR